MTRTRGTGRGAGMRGAAGDAFNWSPRRAWRGLVVGRMTRGAVRRGNRGHSFDEMPEPGLLAAPSLDPGCLDAPSLEPFHGPGRTWRSRVASCLEAALSFLRPMSYCSSASSTRCASLAASCAPARGRAAFRGGVWRVMDAQGTSNAAAAPIGGPKKPYTGLCPALEPGPKHHAMQKAPPGPSASPGPRALGHGPQEAEGHSLAAVMPQGSGLKLRSLDAESNFGSCVWKSGGAGGLLTAAGPEP